MKTFGLGEGVIITYDQEENIDIDGASIRVIPLWKVILSQ